MLYQLSKLIPVPRTGTYMDGSGDRHRSTWVQWRDHVFAHRSKLQRCGCEACAARAARGLAE